MLYEHDSYKNPNMVAIFNVPIYEYDIQSAGYNITREFKLLPEKEINKLNKMTKKERHIYIGCQMRKNKKYKEDMKQGFTNARKLLFESNNIVDDNVITIKKDAIFTLSPCDKTEFGYINFATKHQYTSYIRLGYLEIFYNSKLDTFDIKGISDDLLECHEKGMLKFFRKYIAWMESKDKMVLSKLMRFINRYKSYDLKSDYYRSFDVNSSYTEKNDGSDILNYVMNEYDDDDVCNLDISYNYFNILVPLLEITMKINTSI